MKAISLEKVVNDVEIWVLFASENYVWGTWNRILHLYSGDTQRELADDERELDEAR